ncbi:hypothetical protein D3C76_1217750 [compost metagenome]
MDIGQPQGARRGGVFQGASGHFGVGLGAVVGFDPHQAAMHAFLAAQAHDSGFVEGMPGGQVIGAAAVELAIGHALAQVQAIVVDDETVPQGDHLAAVGQVDTVLAQCREQIPRTPAGKGFIELGGAFGAVAQAGCVAITPSAGADQVGRPVDTAQAAECLVDTQAILDETFAPARTAGGAVVVLAAVEQPVDRQEVAGDGGVFVGVKLIGLRR